MPSNILPQLFKCMLAYAFNCIAHVHFYLVKCIYVLYFFCREICGQPSNQTEEEHVEGPQHGGGPEEAEGEEEAGPQVAWLLGRSTGAR